MVMKMIGRKEEIKNLNRLYESKKAELVAIYGRRRVGKTFLVDQTFKGKFTFKHAGLSPEDKSINNMLEAQLNHFYNSLIIQYYLLYEYSLYNHFLESLIHQVL